MSHTIPSSLGDDLARRVAAATDGLTIDEQALIHGAMAGHSAASWDPLPAPAFAQQAIEAVVLEMRQEPCPWCGKDLVAHSVDVAASWAEVRCHRTGAAMPAQQWLSGPRPITAWRFAVAVACWVLMPLVSLGLLGWVMPALGALVRHRWQWAVASLASLGALVLAMASGSDGLWVGLVVTANWLGSAFCGALQIRPWLTDPRVRGEG